MKLIDRLLKQARGILLQEIDDKYSDNEDEFIQALGLNPANYQIVLPNGHIRYDDMAALNDCSEGLWDDVEGLPN